MNTATLPVSVGVGTVAALVIGPVFLTNVREFVPVDWSHHGEAPDRPSDGVFLAATSRTIVVSIDSTTVSSGAVVTIESGAERIEAIMSRIAHLSTLEDGWVGDGSVPPAEDVLGWLRAHSAVVASGSDALSLIPMEDGSVALRWTEGSREFTAEVRPGLSLYTFVDDIKSDEFSEDLGPLTEERLQAFLRATHDA